VNGDNDRDFQIELAGQHSLTASQILGVGRANLVGTGGAETFLGTAGNDTLSGAGGNDTLEGSAGNDVLQGGLGKDRLVGGEGADTFVFKSAAETLATAAGRDVIADFGAGDLIDLSGMDANVTLAGLQDFAFRGVTTSAFAAAAGELWYYQFEGNTYLIGGVDSDGQRDFQIELTGLHNLAVGEILGVGRVNLTGTGGNDMLLGTAGPDTLRGSAGNDTLVGGLGKDRLVGGEGADHFVFNAAAETPADAGRDVIFDWGVGDLIDLSAIDANTTLDGHQDFVFRGATTAAFSAGAGELWYYQFGGNTYLIGGVDGDGQRDFQIELIGQHILTADRILV
jgi:Ca2+-binding RTX toxin-like protein